MWKMENVEDNGEHQDGKHKHGEPRDGGKIAENMKMENGTGKNRKVGNG